MGLFKPHAGYGDRHDEGQDVRLLGSILMSNNNCACKDASCTTPVSLGDAAKGFRGIIKVLDASSCTGSGLATGEIEHRLMEMGFVEGSVIEVLHEGLFRRDPIAVKVNETTVALRRREARAVIVWPFREDTGVCLAS